MANYRSWVEIFLIIVSLSSIAIAVYSFVQMQALKKSYGVFFDRQNPQSIEQLLKKYDADVKDNAKKLDELATFSANLHKLSSRGLTRVGMVRYNPFNDKGGDQSFCLAALNRHLDGFVLSAIHSRTGARLYAKEIIEGKSKHHLSDEEMRAIQKAMANRDEA
jgi:hypothetical protein